MLLDIRKEAAKIWDREIKKELNKGKKYYIICDNIDGKVKVRDPSLSTADLCYHWFTVSLLLSRVDDSTLSSKPQGDIFTFPSDNFFVSKEESQTMKIHSKHIVAHRLVEVSPLFAKHFKSPVESNPRIEHPYQKEMDSKSSLFPFPIITKDEKKSSESIEIMDIIKV